MHTQKMKAANEAAAQKILQHRYGWHMVHLGWHMAHFGWHTVDLGGTHWLGLVHSWFGMLQKWN